MFNIVLKCFTVLRLSGWSRKKCISTTSEKPRGSDDWIFSREQTREVERRRGLHQGHKHNRAQNNRQLRSHNHNMVSTIIKHLNSLIFESL